MSQDAFDPRSFEPLDDPEREAAARLKRLEVKLSRASGQTPETYRVRCEGVSLEVPSDHILRAMERAQSLFEDRRQVVVGEVVVSKRSDRGFEEYDVNVPRATDVTPWVDFNDPYLKEAVAQLTKPSMTLEEKAARLLTFVQSLADVPEKGDLIHSPIFTLVYGGGDCEDKAILYASLLGIAGVECRLLLKPGHVAVGVAVSEVGVQKNSRFVERDGKRFYAAEPMSNGPVGWSPEAYRVVLPDDADDPIHSKSAQDFIAERSGR